MSLFNALLFCGLVSIVFGECPPHTCTDDHTCCPYETPGEYGCCPYKDGVCCQDLRHCCPNGYVCEPGSHGCIPKMTPLIDSNAFEKRSGLLENEIETGHNAESAMRRSYEEVVLCDDSVYCSIGNTCCRNRDGSFYCCPHPNAVCCEHGMNCCPSGATCDPSSFVCIEEE